MHIHTNHKKSKTSYTQSNLIVKTVTYKMQSKPVTDYQQHKIKITYSLAYLLVV